MRESARLGSRAPGLRSNSCKTKVDRPPAAEPSAEAACESDPEDEERMSGEEEAAPGAGPEGEVATICFVAGSGDYLLELLSFAEPAGRAAACPRQSHCSNRAATAQQRRCGTPSGIHGSRKTVRV